MLRHIRTINQIAAELRQADPETAIGPTWIRQQIAEGKLGYIATGNRKLIALEDVFALIESCMVQGPAADPGADEDEDESRPQRMQRIN